VSATRLLILGALRFMQPAHGYSVRQELESWRADEWANVAFGSIYHALNRMAEEGLLAPVDAERPSRRSARISYVVTPRGEEEFQRLLREYWWERKPLVDPFQVAAAFMNELPRDELLTALGHRLALARGTIDALGFEIAAPHTEEKPRHVAQVLRLSVERLEAEIRWVEATLAKVERGELP